MPLIHIYMNKGKDAAYKRAISDGLHEALLETWNIPEKDRFQIFHETAPSDLQIDPEMWDVQRTDDNIVFHVFTSPRTSEMKLDFYERLPAILQEKAGLRPEDVFVSLSANTREDWSFGNGKAQLLEVDNAAPSPAAMASPNVIARAAGNGTTPVAGLGARTPLAASAGSRRMLTSLAATPRMGGGSALGKLGLVAACGASAFLGTTLASQRLGSRSSE